MSNQKWQMDLKQAWDQNAAFWHSNSRNMWDKGSRQTIIPFMERHFPKGANILDLGCGDGYGSYKLWQTGYEVTGVDLSDEMVRLCQSRLTPEMAKLQFKQANMMNLPFDDAYFDGIMGINVLEWADVPVEALSEITRVTKRNGLLCIGILGPTSAPRAYSYSRLYGRDVIMNTMMPWEFKQLAEEMNLEVIDTENVYKRGVNMDLVNNLSEDLQQALTFLTLFIVRKK